MMGGSESVDFLAPSGSGENTLVTCENGDYAADLEVARAVPRAPEFPPRLDAPEEIETPGRRRRSRRSPSSSASTPAATSKAMPVVKEDGTVVLALVRGDDRLERAKLAAALKADVRPATRGGDPGGVRRRPRLDRAGRLRRRDRRRRGAARGAVRRRREPRPAGTCAASSTGATTRPRFADLREPNEGDACPSCGGALRFETAIEVGHIFKLGTRYSVPLDATFLDEDGTEKPLVMGSYGIGPGRIMAAAVEQLHDEQGICWPAALAPYDVHVVALPGVEEQAEEAARVLARRPAPTSCSTTATSARARSSRTPT